MTFRVVLTDADLHPPDGEVRAVLERCAARLDARTCATQQELREFCRDADAVLCARASITSDVIESMSHCRIIARLGTGYDNIDVKAAGVAGIPVTNVPEFCTNEVAEHTLALILACCRKLPRLDQEVRRGIWNPDSVMPAYRLSGKTLGIVGFGKIGRAVAHRGLAFRMKVFFFDPDYQERPGVQIKSCSSLDELLRQADVVSLHVPLTEQTRGLMALRELRLMKRTSLLINCARGAVIVEADLVQALGDGTIAAAGLDTLEAEPPKKDNPLFDLPNVVITPHCAAHTVEALAGLRRQAYEEIARALQGESLLHVVNKKYLKRTTPELTH